ncbi:hypothetical protein [Ancylomarina longa]|uniref:Iron-only hydrogenase system regulator n=1 Tax=Ancylomarina longa TaxID=2487017 RepID=A0A434AW84_9BACT|nr:hypothetical protein [Ancylomarina longa]RUT78654.1 hypothetical protein DLK05_07405 [Ancylomarina longa]
MISSTIRIFGILIRDKEKEDGCIQKILARYVNSIKTRLGIYDVEDRQNYPYGLIFIQVVGNEEDMNRFEKEIYMIEGVEIQHMFFQS